MKTIEDNLKEETFNRYFGNRVIKYPVSKNGVNVSNYLSINDGRLLKHYEELKQKYGFKRNWLELQSEYVFQAWEAINKFQPDAGIKGWEALSKDSDRHETNKLIKYIKQTVGYKIYEFVNPNAFRTTTTKEGERVHYTLVLEFESLDALLTNGEGEDTVPPINLTDENNLFNNTMYTYYVNHFQKWYEENRDTILAKSQVEFLDNLRKCSNKPYLTASEFEETTGVKWADYSRRLRKIEERIAKAWEKEKPVKQSRKQVFNSGRIKFFQEYMTILNNDNCLQAQNLLLTNHLVKGVTDIKVELDIFQLTNDELALEELIHFNKIAKDSNHRNVPLSGQILYKLTNAIEALLITLVDGQEELTEEIKLEKPKPTMKKARKTTIKTYNQQGTLIGHEVSIAQEQVQHKNIFYLLPSGVKTRER